MISIKGGTQTWSSAKQESSLKGSNKEILSADEKEKYFGGKDLGEILNKVADPNWIPPSKRKRQVGNNALDKDAFLKLFLAHLKNQDPTNPMQSHEMAAQLAQFTSLEKLENIDGGIKEIVRSNQAKQKSGFEALSLIGRVVSGDTSKIIRSSSDEVHEVTFKLPHQAKSGKAQIFDENQNLIKEYNLSNLKSGENSIEWDGKDSNGTPVKSGLYKVKIEAIGSNNKKLAVETKFQGRVTGVNYTPQGPVLLIGKKAVKLSDVKKISDASQEESEKVNKVQASEVKPKKDGKQDDNIESSLQSVGMERGLVNKLQKETGQSHGIN
ncbi:MAG: hypothetical protein D6797_05995 [Bdellovibrio sp.]|nr:MAG: hypothetical protein D6797_05995 [Bdellovibrio sp.]